MTIVPDMDDNSDADSLASALFRDDLNSLAQLIIPSALLGVLMDGDNDALPPDHHEMMPPRELMVKFDTNETVEIKYDGLKHTIVSSHDVNHPAVPNGRAVDSVTIVKDKGRFKGQRERDPSNSPRKLLPSFGLSRMASNVKSASRKSKWSSSASLMSYAWRPRRMPQGDNASLTKIENNGAIPNNIKEEIKPKRKSKKGRSKKPAGQGDLKSKNGGIKTPAEPGDLKSKNDRIKKLAEQGDLKGKNGRIKTPPEQGDLNSIQTTSALGSLLSFRNKNSNREGSDDRIARDYASLDEPARSPRRRRRLLQGKHRNVAVPLAEEESPLGKTVSSTSVTSSSSSPPLPSIPVITHTAATSHTISSSMGFFLPQWPVKSDDDDEGDHNNNIIDKHGMASFSPTKVEGEPPSWSKFNVVASGNEEEREEPQDNQDAPQVLRHVIVVQEESEPPLVPDGKKGPKKGKPAEIRTAMAKPGRNHQFKLSLPNSKHRSSSHNPGSKRLASVESFDSFYDGVITSKQKGKPKPQKNVVKQEFEFDAFQDYRKNNEMAMSLDRHGQQDQKGGQIRKNLFSFRPSFVRRHHVEPKAPVDSISIPLLPKSDSAAVATVTDACGTPWTPAMLLCAAGGGNSHQLQTNNHPHHRFTSSASATSSLAEDESVDMDETDLTPRQDQQPLKDDENVDEDGTAEGKPAASTRLSWFRRQRNQQSSGSRRRGRSQPPAASLETPFPIVREDYSMNDGSYHVLKIGGPKN